MVPGRFEIRHDLSDVNRSELLDRLQLNNELTTDEQIESRVSYVSDLVVDSSHNLSCKRDIA